MVVFGQILNCPLGDLLVKATNRGICAVHFHETGSISGNWRSNQITTDACRQLQEYFAGKRREFTVPLDMGGTEFQKAVWNRLLGISFGSTCSYGQVSKELGNPDAVRAVGAANGKNPIAVIVPCHRVIGADGTLTGYAGGLNRKKWLLDHESAIIYGKQGTIFAQQ